MPFLLSYPNSKWSKSTCISDCEIVHIIPQNKNIRLRVLVTGEHYSLGFWLFSVAKFKPVLARHSLLAISHFGLWTCVHTADLPLHAGSGFVCGLQTDVILESAHLCLRHPYYSRLDDKTNRHTTLLADGTSRRCADKMAR